MDEIKTNDFDYSVLNDELAEKIKEKDYILIGLHSKYSEEVGKVLHEAQQVFSDYNNGGLFEKWYTSRGFKKRNVYNYIQIYNEVQSLHGDKLEVFQELPKSLQIEASKKSVDTELKEKILSGDITTHKQFKEMEQAKNKAEQRAKQAESQAETERKERERLELENKELANVEPEIIEKEVIKEIIPEHVNAELEQLERVVESQKLAFDEAKRELETYRLRDANSYDEEEARKEIQKLSDEADKSVLRFKIKVDRFIEEVAITSFMEGAIASCSDPTRKKLQDSVDYLKSFTKKMESTLKGRVEI